MKNLFTLFLALVACAGTIFAEGGYCGDNLTWNLTDGVLTISGTGAMKNYYVSDDNNLPPWIDYRDYIIRVLIGNSVTSIGENAFGSLTRLKSATIGNSVTSLGDFAFNSCDSLTSVNIPNSVTSIGDGAFSGCKGLTSFIIPNSVTSIGDWVFKECTGLTSVTIGNSVTSIGWSAFEECTGLKSVIIPNSVTSIGQQAFYYCSALTSITIPNRVTDIGSSAFSGCSSLKSVNIPNSVTQIGQATFYGCSSLKSVNIPSSITFIGDNAFYECSGLTSVTCEAVTPPTCGYYNYNAFDGVNKSIPLYVPAGSVNAYKTAPVWKDFKNIQTLPGAGSCLIFSGTFSAHGDNFTWEIDCDSVLTISGTGAMPDFVEEDAPWLGYSSRIKSVTIGNSVTSIGEAAFAYCTVLTSVTIPNSVTSIGWYAFSGCSGLTSITCEATTPPSCKVDAFYGVDKSIPLYVLAESVDLYKAAEEWKDFKNILPISAEETETTEVQTTPTENTVDVTWPAVDGAYTYEIVIKDKNGNTICTLIFDAEGRLKSIAFSAPAHGDAPQKAQTAGFSFTVTGLDAGKEYNLTITAKNEDGLELDKKNVSFHTNWPQGIEDVTNDKSQMTNKVIKDGQIYILRGDKTYTITGQEVR